MASATSICQLSDSEEGTETAEYPRFAEVLENELLLTNIFQKLWPRGCEDLKTCRAVSHLWKDEATTSLQKNYWQNRKFVRLSNEETMQKYIKTFGDSPENTIFSCYMIEQDYKLPDAQNFKTDLLNGFFNEFGLTIKSLSIDCNFNLIHLQNQLSTMASSLEELRIWIPRDFFYNRVDYIPKLKNPEFKLNLSYLCLTFGILLYGQPVGPEVQQCNKVLDLVLNKVQVPPPGGKELKICLMQWQDIKLAIVSLEKYKQVRNLKILEIREVKVGEMKALTEIGHQIQLEYLSLDPNKLRGVERFIIAQEIYEFLCTQANNLEMLQWASAGYFKFPEKGLPNLKKLRLRCAQGYGDNEPSDEEREAEGALLATFDPINYQDLFPQLEELHLLYNVAVPDPEEFGWLFLDPQDPCLSLRELRVKYPEMSVDMLRTISTIFPFITSLSLWVESPEDEIRNFYETLWGDANFVTNLKELYIEMRFLSYPPNHEFKFESLFAGLDEEIIKNVVDIQSYDFELPEHLVRPSIRDLANLKKFSLSNTNRHEICYSSSYFTDFSAFCVFGKMENLEYLHLEKGIRRFSKAGFDHLRNKCKLEMGTNAEVSCHSVSADEKIEEVFRTGFTYKKMNSSQPVNLIDSKLSDDENEHIPPVSPPPSDDEEYEEFLLQQQMPVHGIGR